MDVMLQYFPNTRDTVRSPIMFVCSRTTSDICMTKASQKTTVFTNTVTLPNDLFQSSITYPCFLIVYFMDAILYTTRNYISKANCKFYVGQVIKYNIKMFKLFFVAVLKLKNHSWTENKIIFLMNYVHIYSTKLQKGQNL